MSEEEVNLDVDIKRKHQDYYIKMDNVDGSFKEVVEYIMKKYEQKPKSLLTWFQKEGLLDEVELEKWHVRQLKKIRERRKEKLENE